MYCSPGRFPSRSCLIQSPSLYYRVLAFMYAPESLFDKPVRSQRTAASLPSLVQEIWYCVDRRQRLANRKGNIRGVVRLAHLQNGRNERRKRSRKRMAAVPCSISLAEKPPKPCHSRATDPQRTGQQSAQRLTRRVERQSQHGQMRRLEETVWRRSGSPSARHGI